MYVINNVYDFYTNKIYNFKIIGGKKLFIDYKIENDLVHQIMIHVYIH